jgi:hypothetical protein
MLGAQVDQLTMNERIQGGSARGIGGLKHSGKNLKINYPVVLRFVLLARCQCRDTRSVAT